VHSEQHADLRDAEEALQFLDPGCAREEWVKIAMAAKAAGIDFPTFDAWSAQAPNYDQRNSRDTWRSIKTDGAINSRSLFWRARQAGWKSSAGSSLGPETKSYTRSAEEPGPRAPALSAPDVWGRCIPATASHAYIEAKQGLPEGLRVVPGDDPLTIAGLSMVGALVVPVLPIEGGEPVSLQFIASPDLAKVWEAAGLPPKLNLPGAPLTGVFVVGNIDPVGTAYICEGIGQAWACWKAKGPAAVACFGWGRVRAVAAELRLRHPDLRLVLVPDVGKESEAEVIARDVRALVAYMPEGFGNNTDVNDLGLRDGFDKVENMLDEARTPPPTKDRFKPLGSAEVLQLPLLSWRVRDVLPASGVACLYGPSGSGKSFLALDMAATIAEGGRWFGHRVTPSAVVYVCQEGAAGVRQRVMAWEQHHGRPLPQELRIVLDPFKLTSPQDIIDLGNKIVSMGSGAVTIIDTLNASAPGIDENSSKDMGTVIEATKTLQRMTEGLVVLVHHTGKDRSAGLRGHSSLVAALDAAIEVNWEAKGRHWKLAKAKDGADGELHSFVLDVVTLNQDSDEEPMTSCVVRKEAASGEVKKAVADVKVPRGGNQRLVYDRIRERFSISVSARPGVPPMRPTLDLEEAVRQGAAALTCPPDRRTSRARDAITGLVNRGVFGLYEGILWIP
jgi:hypothetical protein